MPFDSPASAFRDIAEAIGDIQQFTEGMDFEAFWLDLKTIAAVERKLLVVSEAAIRLKDDAPGGDARGDPRCQAGLKSLTDRPPNRTMPRRIQLERSA